MIAGALLASSKTFEMQQLWPSGATVGTFQEEANQMMQGLTDEQVCTTVCNLSLLDAGQVSFAIAGVIACISDPDVLPTEHAEVSLPAWQSAMLCRLLVRR